MVDEKKYNHPSFDRLVEAYGIKRGHGEVKRIAEITGAFPHTVSGWKTSGVPEKIYLKACIRMGVRVDWMETGEGPMRDDPPEGQLQQIKEGQGDYYSPTTHKIAQMVEAMDEESRKNICLSVEKDKLLQDLLRQRESNEKAG